MTVTVHYIAVVNPTSSGNAGGGTVGANVVDGAMTTSTPGLGFSASTAPGQIGLWWTANTTLGGSAPNTYSLNNNRKMVALAMKLIWAFITRGGNAQLGASQDTHIPN